MTEREERDDEIIVLTDEEGQEHEFAVIQVIKVDEKDYAILLPTEGDTVDEDEAEAVILRIDADENGEDILVEIEDEDEFERVADAWEELLDAEDWTEEEADDEDR